MLTLSEEIILLSFNEKLGQAVSVSGWSLSCAMAGATLMDLALANRIDTDIERLTLVDSTPLNDDILDPVLAEIVQANETRDCRFWIEHLAAQGKKIREKALSRLVACGILEAEEDGFSFVPGVSQARRYPMFDARVREEVRLRVMRVLFDNDIPEPHDIMIISLANACGIFEHLLSSDEFELIKSRLATVVRLELISRSVVEVVRQGEPASKRVVPSREIPMVSPLPLTTRLLNLYRDWLVEQHLNLGPIFKAKIGKKDVVIMAGPESNMFFTKHDRTHFRSREFWLGVDDQLGASRSTLSMVGEDHFRLRRVKKYGYSCPMGEIRIPDIVDVVRSEIASWPIDKPMSGTTTCKRIIYNLTARVIAGISAPEYFDDLSFWLDETMKYAVLKKNTWYSRRRLNSPRYDLASQRLNELAEKIVAAHDPDTRGDRPRDIIDDLLATHRSDPLFLSEADLKTAILEPMWIPMDTTGHVTSFLLYVLLKYHDLQQRARTEADELFAQGSPTAQGIHQLDVTHRIVLETMRMYLPIAAHNRTVTNSFEFAGYRIPAGTNVVIAGGISHFLPKYYPDPKTFDIDRFAPPRNEHKQPGAYCPFGLGTHRCLGAALAEFLMMTTMATILHDVEVVLDPPNYTLTRWKIDSSTAPRPDKSFRFRLVRKRSNGGLSCNVPLPC